MERIFNNHKNLKMDDLSKSNLYPSYLLKNLMYGIFSDLNALPFELKSDVNYMEPLLYAVRNELGTFEVYKYYTENLQENPKLGSEIVKVEPHLIENTPLSENADFIVQNIESSPQIVRYMSPALKADPEVIEEICLTNNIAVLKEVVIHCDSKVVSQTVPELRNNRNFISTLAVESTKRALEFASESLKNDSQFLKDLVSKNNEVVDVIVANPDEFNSKCINDIQQVVKGNSMDQSIDTCSNLANEDNDKRYSSVIKYVEKNGNDDPKSFLAATAMAAQNENLDPASIKNIFNYSLLTMEKIKREMSSENYVPTKEHLLELVSANNINKLRSTLEKQGIALPPEMQQQLDDYEKFQRDYTEKYKECKSKARKEAESLSPEKPIQNNDIQKSEFSNLANDFTVSDVQKTTDIIREAISREEHQKNIQLDSMDFNNPVGTVQSGNIEELDESNKERNDL